MHQTIAFRTAWVITRSAADAEEAAQDAFVKAHAALGRFREGAPFRPWLLAIVANEARNRVRSAGRRAGLALRVAEERRPDDAVPSPEAALLDSERRDQLLAAIERLPEGRARRSRAATCWSSRRRRRPPRWTARAAPSSRACRARSTGCARSWGRRWRHERARAPADRSRPRAGLAGRPRPHPLGQGSASARTGSPASAHLRQIAGDCIRGPSAACGRSDGRSPERSRRGARVLRASGRDRRAARAAAARAAARPLLARRAHDARRRARLALLRPARAERRPGEPAGVYVNDLAPAARSRSPTARPMTSPRRAARASACSSRSSAATWRRSSSARSRARPPGSNGCGSTASARSGWRVRRTSSSTGRRTRSSGTRSCGSPRTCCSSSTAGCWSGWRAPSTSTRAVELARSLRSPAAHDCHDGHE